MGILGGLQGRLPRAGGDLQRGGAALRRRAGLRRARPAREHLRHGRGAPRRRRGVGDRADRELARRLDQRHARPARRRGRRRADRGRDAAHGQAFADRARGRSSCRRSTRSSPIPRFPGSARGFCAASSPHARVLSASSTAEAVREVVEDARPGRAALGTRLAAEIYGGTVLREGVQDRDDNETRFVWLARAGEGAPTARAATPRRRRRRAALEDLARVLGSRR